MVFFGLTGAYFVMVGSFSTVLCANTDRRCERGKTRLWPALLVVLATAGPDGYRLEPTVAKLNVDERDCVAGADVLVAEAARMSGDVPAR